MTACQLSDADQNATLEIIQSDQQLISIPNKFNFISTETWHHCTTLDSNNKFHVCWRVVESKDDPEIEFKVEVKAHGYVALGLSPNGGMTSSDIVTGWIKDGKVYFQDRYAEGYFLPKIDEIQNWDLVSGSENDTHSVLLFRRKLDTCDKEDRKIDDSTTRLIYAYSDIDPPSEYALDYHFTNRGSKSVYLLQRKLSKHVKIDKSSLAHWDVLSPNFTLDSTSQTMYWCKIHKAPELSEKHHIVLVEPLIQKGNEAFVHHLLLYECVGANRKEYEPHTDQYGHQCHRANMPDAMKKCEGVSLAWGIGGEDLILPEDVGLPLEASPAKYYMLEIHYDNPNKIAGIVDNSGFRIYYSPKIRKYDAGTLMIGATTSSRVLVPPKRKEYVVAGHSNPKCLDPFIIAKVE
ncbi:DBH-like monooxygenase protein 1-like [Argiope bruennichi]|uniref:DBH-like monooxygenase protein 1-like n=1 Tax=Argiope bruennichi TaxID=94029 RepID=A0A8T0FZF7_ARGBR|nr:DBH-like monooxygenase protein 1-like [Argiope bruennichi]